MKLLKERLMESFQKHSYPLKPIPAGTDSQLHKLDDIHFLIFDFYGTIFLSGVGDIGIDDASANSSNFTEALIACGLELSDPAAAGEWGDRFFTEMFEERCGELIREGLKPPEPAIEGIWLSVLQKLSDASLVTGITSMDAARLFAVEYEARINPAWPVPGLLETLADMRSDSLELGIISNSQFYTPVLFEALTGQSLVESGFNEHLLHWSYEERVKKPAVLLYETFLEKLLVRYPGTPPGSILYVGNDMLKDMYPASVLGIKTALYAGDKRSLKWRNDHELCRDLKPDLVITDIRQLKECV